MKPISLIIPTYNNMDFFMPCLESITSNTVESYRIHIINNGSEELSDYLTGDIGVFRDGTNHGWAGGINRGIENLHEDSDYLLLMNDDTMILPNDYDWMHKLRNILDNDETVAAVGPSSNVVMGLQHFGRTNLPRFISTKYLIGFCVMMRRKLFEDLGAMDESLIGGDDLDWSIRFRKAGYKLIARRDTFVYHFGFKTGERVHGDPATPNGWNSAEMQEKTNIGLIKKHGFRWFVSTIRNQPEQYDTKYEEYGEDGILAQIAVGKGIDVGCGNQKVVADAIGVDLCAFGEKTFQDTTSVADIKASGDNLHMFADGSLDYVVARHNIEHYSNPIKALREWHRVLKPDGKIGLCTPDDGCVNGIRLDSSHRHSFSRDCMRDLLQVTGFEVESLGGTANGWDFYVIARKNGHA